MSEISKIQMERIARFKKMGLPSNAGQINQISEVVASGKQGAHKTLQDIKRGAKRNTFKKFIDAEKSAAASESGYQIPETKSKSKQRQSQEKSSYAVMPKSFSAKRSSEANSLENMMLGNTSTASEGSAISDVSLPNFDPATHLQQKIAEKEAQPQQQNIYQESNEISEMKTMIETLLNNQSYGGNDDLNKIKKMMYAIAKEVAKDTMKTVINEFLAESKKKNTYEVYNKKQNVVKINNKLYKLTPVKIKN